MQAVVRTFEPGEVFDDPCRLLDWGGEVRMRP